MSGGGTNDARFEQIGQSWMKHTFLALEDFVCGTCNTSGCQTGSHLCPGCSDPYVSSLNGDQDSIGSRAWINPFTGSFPSSANNHNGHVHNGVSHRVLVETSDLIPANNPGASILAKPPTLAPMNTHGASRIPGSATCLTISPIVVLDSPAVRILSILGLSVLPSEWSLQSRR